MMEAAELRHLAGFGFGARGDGDEHRNDAIPAARELLRDANPVQSGISRSSSATLGRNSAAIASASLPPCARRTS